MGFCMHGQPVDLGPEPYAIYRAAPVDRAKGMSWCTHLDMAKNFQPKHKQHGEYTLWRASVTKRSVLAVLHRPDDSWLGLGSKTAREVVVDPVDLGEVMPAARTRDVGLLVNDPAAPVRAAIRGGDGQVGNCRARPGPSLASSLRCPVIPAPCGSQGATMTIAASTRYADASCSWLIRLRARGQ